MREQAREEDVVWKGFDWNVQPKSEDTRVDALCPVCGRVWATAAYPPETLGKLAATARHGSAVYMTCDKHSLADVHRMYHPYQIRERRHRR